MGNCTIFYDELRFDVRDPQALHAYVFIRCEGDCMHTLHGWHHKAFPVTTTTQEVVTAIFNGETDFLTWEREAPRPVLTPVIFNPHDKVPVKVEQLVAWREYLATRNTPTPCEMAEQISAYLTAVPDWQADCPYCRAHSVFERMNRG